jgi:hypothetical protein
MEEMARGFKTNVGTVIATVTDAATELMASSSALARTADDASSRSSVVAAAAGEAPGNV